MIRNYCPMQREGPRECIVGATGDPCRHYTIEETCYIFKAFKNWSCKHIVDNSNYKDGPAFCKYCGTEVGKYCNNSPDNICHYESIRVTDGWRVQLLEGNHDLPFHYNKELEDKKHCIFCGNER